MDRMLGSVICTSDKGGEQCHGTGRRVGMIARQIGRDGEQAFAVPMFTQH